MKAKNQPSFPSDVDAKDKLIVFVYEYLVHSGAKQAAIKFIESIGYNKNIEIKEGPGFLMEWWCVFWDLYCATPEKRHLQPESSPEARAYHDFMRSAPMSPSITQASPPHQQPPPQFMSGPGGPRHHGPHAHPHPRGPPQPSRMQAGPPHSQHPHHQHPGGPPPPSGPPGTFMQASPRYRQHQGPPTHQTHMSQGGPPHGPPPPPMSYGPGPERIGQSPSAMNPMSSMSNQQPLPPSMVGGGGGMQSNQQPPPQDDYVVPDGYEQQNTDQPDAGSEIRMLKESLESDTNDGDQSSFSMDFAESQGKW